MKTILSTLCLLGMGLSLQGQTLKGKVFGKGDHEKEILPGAAVHWLGTTIGTNANENGVFEIRTDSITNKQLIISFVGYEPDTVIVTNQTYISVTLQGSKQLKEVTVVGEQGSAYISAINPIKTEVITQKELTKSACCDLAGCFETQASVQPQTTNVITNSKELRILGLSGVYNQLLFDGMPMFQGLSFTYGISSIPGTLVDNIFVSKGANSVLQGYESISGQINVLPKMPDKAEKLLLNTYLNSFMEKHFNANYSTHIGKNNKWSTLFTIHSVQPANRYDRDKDNFLDLPLLTRYMFYNRWKYGNETKKGVFTHIGARYLNERRIGGQTLVNPRFEKGSAIIYGQFVNYSQPELYTKTGYRFNDDNAIVFIISGFYQNQNSYFGTVKYDAHQLNGYTNLQHEWLWKEQHLLKYGVSFRYQDLRESINFTDTTLRRTYSGLYSTRQIIPGAFAENSFHWNEDRVIWIIGTRLDKHHQFGSIFTPRTLLKYSINTNNTIRGSVGTGWRQVNLFSENINLLVSSRDIVFAEKLKPEQGLNWGMNYTYTFDKEQVSGNLSVDFYQTRFFNQFFPDYDSAPTKAIVKNFTGTSISNGLQVEANFSFFKVAEFRLAYNYLDVYREINGLKYLLPFNPKNRVMAAISYRPKNDKWYWDMNAHWYDRQRLPNTDSNPAEYQYADYSKPYFLINAQITRKWKKLDVYAGSENIFDFRQERPILSWQDPFSKYFDTSSVWGPTRGREVYLGFRFKIK